MTELEMEQNAADKPPRHLANLNTVRWLLWLR
jgi:hypothetical protein